MSTKPDGQSSATSSLKQQRPGNSQSKPTSKKQRQVVGRQSNHSRAGDRSAQMDSADDGYPSRDRGRRLDESSHQSSRARSRARSVSRPPWTDNSRSGVRHGYTSDEGDRDGFIRVPRITFEGPGEKRFVRVYDDTMHFSWVLALIRHRCLIDTTKPLRLLYCRDTEDDRPVELEDEDDFTGLRALAWEGSDIKVTIIGVQDPSAAWPAPPLLNSVNYLGQTPAITPHRSAAPQHSTPNLQTTNEPRTKRQKITSFAGDLAASATKKTSADIPVTERSASERPPVASTQRSEAETILESSNSASTVQENNARKRAPKGKQKKTADADDVAPPVAGQKRKVADNVGDAQDHGDSEPKTKRKRRTKAEMQAARSAEAAAKANKDGVVNGEVLGGSTSATRKDQPPDDDDDDDAAAAAATTTAAAAAKEAKKAKKQSKEAKKALQQENLSQQAPTAPGEDHADVIPVQSALEAPSEGLDRLLPSTESSTAYKKQLEKGCAICLSLSPHDIEACPTILAGRPAVKARVDELKEKKQRKVKPERNAQTELIRWLKEHPASSAKKKKQSAEKEAEGKEISKGSGPTTGESAGKTLELPSGPANGADGLLPQSSIADGVAVGNGAFDSPDRMNARSAQSGSTASDVAESNKIDKQMAKQKKGIAEAETGGELAQINSAKHVPPSNADGHAIPNLGHEDLTGQQQKVGDRGRRDSGADSDTSDDSNEEDEDEEDFGAALPTSAQQSPVQANQHSSTSASSESSSETESSSSSGSDYGNVNVAQGQRKKSARQGSQHNTGQVDGLKNAGAGDEDEHDELQSTQASFAIDNAQLPKAPSPVALTPWQRAASLIPFGRSRDSAAFSTKDDVAPTAQASQSARKSKPPLLSELTPDHFRKSSFTGSQPGSPVVTPGATALKPAVSQLSRGALANGRSASNRPQSSDESDGDQSDSDSSVDEVGGETKATSSTNKVPATRRAGAASKAPVKKGRSGFFKAFNT